MVVYICDLKGHSNEKTHFSGSIHIYCDNSDNPGLWTKLVIESKQVMSEDDGSADYGIVPYKVVYLCTDDFSSAQAKLPNKIWNYITANPYISSVISLIK